MPVGWRAQQSVRCKLSLLQVQWEQDPGPQITSGQEGPSGELARVWHQCCSLKAAEGKGSHTIQQDSHGRCIGGRTEATSGARVKGRRARGERCLPFRRGL